MSLQVDISNLSVSSKTESTMHLQALWAFYTGKDVRWLDTCRVAGRAGGYRDMIQRQQQGFAINARKGDINNVGNALGQRSIYSHVWYLLQMTDEAVAQHGNSLRLVTHLLLHELRGGR